MPSFILLDPGITKTQVNMCEKIVYDTYHMFSRTKNGKIVEKLFFVSKSGPLMIKLDHVILFEYYFRPFDSARRLSSCLGP